VLCIVIAISGIVLLTKRTIVNITVEPSGTLLISTLSHSLSKREVMKVLPKEIQFIGPSFMFFRLKIKGKIYKLEKDGDIPNPGMFGTFLQFDPTKQDYYY